METYGGVPMHVKKTTYSVYLPRHTITAGYLIEALKTIPSGAEVEWESVFMPLMHKQQPSSIDFHALERQK
jgi:hypothetical protein